MSHRTKNALEIPINNNCFSPAGQSSETIVNPSNIKGSHTDRGHHRVGIIAKKEPSAMVSQKALLLSLRLQNFVLFRIWFCVWKHLLFIPTRWWECGFYDIWWTRITTDLYIFCIISIMQLYEAFCGQNVVKPRAFR